MRVTAEKVPTSDGSPAPILVKGGRRQLTVAWDLEKDGGMSGSEMFELAVSRFARNTLGMRGVVVTEGDPVVASVKGRQFTRRVYTVTEGDGVEVLRDLMTLDS